MPGLVPGIHVLLYSSAKGVHGRGHKRVYARLTTRYAR
jgi:hypothetical protein